MALESIALIPSGYKANKLYCQLPVDGGADLTTSRASTATRVNKNGLIEDVATGVPRLDYLDGGCPSLLLEPASTNLITYSEGFNNWASVFTTVSLNEVVSPDGSVNATKLTDTSNSSTHRIQIGNTTSSSGSFCYSIFLKKGTLTTVALSVYSGADAADSKFDLDNGSIVSTTNGTAEIQDYGNDWYRCIVKGTLASTSTTVYIYLKEKASYSGSSQFLYAWGAQLEQKSYATSYIPTSGSTETRDAETATKTGLSSYINSTEGVLYAEISALADDLTERYWSLTDGSNQDYILIGYSNNSNEVIGQIRDNGSIQRNFTTTLPNTTDFAKLCVKWNGTNFYFYVNGLLIDSGSYSSITGLSNLKQGRDGGSLPFYGKTKELRVYKEALSDLELARLTGFTSFAEMRDYLNYTAE